MTGWAIIPLFLIGSLGAAEPCANWAKQCKDLQAFRRHRFDKARAETQAAFCFGCATISKSLFSKINDVRQAVSPAGYDPAQFRICLQREANAVTDFEGRDARILLEEIAKAGVSSITAGDVSRILLDPGGYYAKLKARVRADDPPLFYYRDYALSGPYQNLEESFTGKRVSPGSVGVSKFDRSVRDALEKAGDGRAAFRLLADRSLAEGGSGRRASVISPSSARDPLTPAMAKLVLFEILRDRIKNNPEIMRRVLSRLTLKFDFMNPRSTEVKDPDTVTLHNGYYLGADLDHAPTDPAHPASTGYDCTAIIQKCQTRAGLILPMDFKLLSSRLAAMGDPAVEPTYTEMNEYHALYDARPFRCEDQLEPGDVVAFNGHAFVFDGYFEDSTGRLKLKTFEAIAGEYRSFGQFERELYPSDPCAPAQFSSAGETWAKIVRVRQ